MDKTKKLILISASFCFVVVVMMIAVAFAQEAVTDEMRKAEIESIIGKPMDQWGTTTSVYSVSAFDCEPYDSTMVYHIDSNDGRKNRYCGANLVCNWYCPVHLPSGAEIQSFEIDGCDLDSIGYINASLLRIHWGGAVQTVVSKQSSTASVCSYWTSSDPDCTIDNWNNTYVIYAELISQNGLVSINSFRIYYNLQVSPAPSTATFVDVPTSHIFFRYVEALVDAGITGGCDATHFCPNDYVTRGQMAKFIAVALGLNY